jgi:hypothetical protein
MIAILWLTLLLQAGAAEPQTGETPEAVPGTGEDPALAQEVKRVGRRIEDLLETHYASAPVAVRAPADLRRVAADIRLLQMLPRERLEARTRAWQDVGLGTGDSPARLYRLLAADIEGVAVDPTNLRLLVDPDRLTLLDFAPREEGAEEDPSSVLLLTGIRPDEPLVVHALVHLLLDVQPGGATPETTDALLAASAWAEGRANLVAIRYLFQTVGVGPDILTHALDPGEVLDGALLPPLIDHITGPDGVLLDWVYGDGFQQAVESLRQGGMEGLRTAVLSRRTTRDISHLDRPPIRPEPIPEPAPPTEGLELADRDTLGEQGIVVLISTWTGKDNLALIAGDGWAGDALLRWEPPAGGDGVTQWITRWSTAEEAADFEYAYLRGAQARFPIPIQDPEAEGPHTFEGPDRTVVVRRNDKEVQVHITPRTTPPAVDETSTPAPSGF